MHLCKSILIFGLFLGLIQCGGDNGPSAQVDVQIAPTKPQISNSDLPFVIPNGTSSPTIITITAPLTSPIQITITNRSTDTLNVTGIRYESTYQYTDPKTRVSSTLTSGPTDILPAEFTQFLLRVISKDARSGTDSCLASDANLVVCDQSVFAVIPPNPDNPYTLKSLPLATTSITPTPTTSPLNFYLSSLPKNDGRNFNYVIKLTVLGYFGTPTNISNRLTKSIYFTTQ